MDLLKCMKLLFISSDKFPPYRVDIDVLFGQELRRRGYNIDWILQSNTPCSTTHITKWGNWNVWVGKTNLGHKKLDRIKKHILSFINDLKVFSLLKSKNYDFLQVKDKFLSASIALFACKALRVRYIYWLSFPFPEESLYKIKEGTARYPFLYFLRGHTFSFILYKIILRRADHIIVQSEQMKKDILEKIKIPARRITAVPMGVNLSSIPYELLDSMNMSQQNMDFNIVYLGTLDRNRRIVFLVRVFALVLQRQSNCKLFLVGGENDESDIQLLKTEIQRLGLQESVILTGFLPMSEAWEHVRQASVCLSFYYPTPILNSTSPTKLVEYMAMGKPVVANEHPEQRLIIEQSGCGYCVQYDEKEFAEAIISILQDKEKAKLMGAKGRKYVEQYRSYSNISSFLHDTYTQILKGNEADVF